MLKSLLKSRRSIRKFTDQKVEPEKKEYLIKAALLAPSSRGNNPWKFIVVDDEELIQKLSKSKEHGSEFLKNAPLGIVVAADPQKSDVWVEDTSIASILIQLAAEDMGLGTCWIQIRNRMSDHDVSSEEYVKGVLNIPQNLRIESIIGIGYPAESKPAYAESDLLYDKVYKNEYNNSYY